MGYYDYYGWKPYVPVAERRRKAERELQKLKKKGQTVSPVVIEGRTIARTFWGKAWCENLERYSDYSNRLPRGRTYVRNGSVVDLQIAPGEIAAVVSGSDIYRVRVQVSAVPKARWTSICADCAGAIDSLIELLQGRFSKGVMERICQEKTGLFPAPAELTFSCSCPDWASMCKHVAAVFYGVGARLDEQPELLFALRRVDQKELIARASKGKPLSEQGPAKHRVLAADDLSELFGLEMAAPADEPKPADRARAQQPANDPRPAKASSARRPAKPRSKPVAPAAPARPTPRRSATNAKKKAAKRTGTGEPRTAPKTRSKAPKRRP